MNSGEIEYWCQSNTPSKAESCCNFFLGLFAFMIQPEVQIISDVGMIRKATNRYPEINNLSNRKAPFCLWYTWLTHERCTFSLGPFTHCSFTVR